MIINEDTKIIDLIRSYPYLEEFLKNYNEKFSLLANPIVRQTMGRVATLKMAADIAGVDVKRFIDDINAEITKNQTREELSENKLSKQEILKGIISDLHKGVNFEEVKRRFNDLIKDLDAAEIAAMEESLIREGMPVQEVQRLCDLHVNVFKNILDQKQPVSVSNDHPLYMYQLENRRLQDLLKKAQDLLPELSTENATSHKEMRELILRIQEINYHYLRKENQLFPYLERHDFTGPSQVMWGIHDEIRKQIKEIIKLLDDGNIDEVKSALPRLIIALAEMVYKEENILFPTALKLLSQQEWDEIKKGENEIGFSFVDQDISEKKASYSLNEKVDSNTFNLSTGRLTITEIDSILKTLPVDISFVDVNDEVKYYSDTVDRIFPRSPAVIGRKVQRCHPPKSVHIVEKILNAFKNGEKNVAEFYIKLNGRDIHIRYFAVRDREGKYLGTLEVSQDITDIKRLDREKRLLDWE